MKNLANVNKKLAEIYASAEYKNAIKHKELTEQSQDLSQVLKTSKNPSTGFEHKSASLTGSKDINITAKQGVLIEGSGITSNTGSITILAEGNLASTDVKDGDDKTVGVNHDSIRITGLADIYQQGDINKAGKVTGSNYSYHQLINQPTLTANKDIKILAQGGRPVNTASKVFTDNNAVNINSADIQSTNGDVRIDAARGDINLEASQVAFMDGSQTSSTSRKWYGKKKTKTTTTTSLNSNAVTTDIVAKNIILKAESDIAVYGSELNAGTSGEVSLKAGREIKLYAIKNIDENAVDIKKKSSFLGVRYNKEHTNDTRQEITQLPADIVASKFNTESGGDTLLEGTIVNTANKAKIRVGIGQYAEADAKVILGVITNQITTTHNQEKESTVWQKTVDQGSVVTTAQLPKFNQVPTITSPGGVTVAVPVDVTVDSNNKAKTNIQKSQEDLGRIALNLSKQPGYEYLAALDKTNDINWVQVDLIQKNWNYTQEGLTPGAAALIAIAVTIATSGAGGAAGMGATLTGTTGAMGAAATAAFSSLAAQASVTLINNKGDINKTLNQLASSATVRSMATAALTAGLTAKLNLPQMANNDFANKLVNGVAEGATGAFVNAAVNGVSLEDALKNSLRSSLVDVFAAETFSSFVKNIDTNDFADNLAHKLVAAGVGCVTASAKKQSCDAGALGAAVGEMFGDYLVDDPSKLTAKQIADTLDAAKFLAGTVALLINIDVNTAANTAGLAVENNALKNIKDHCLNWTNCFEEFSKVGVSEHITTMKRGQWQLIQVFNKQGDTIGYKAYNTITKENDFIVRNNEIQDFMNATPILIENLVQMAKLTESNPKAMNQMTMSAMSGSFAGYVKAWKDGVQDPYFLVFVGSGFIGSSSGPIASRVISQAEMQQMTRMSGMLRKASSSKGNFGIGTATRAEANAMGKAWVGEGYTIASDGKTLVSSDHLRQYRPPTPKNSSYATTGTQANFEELQSLKNTSKQGHESWKLKIMRNGHLNIKD